MTGLPPHDHDLDGRMHEGCPMCAEAKRRQHGRQLDVAADQLADRYAALVERSGRYRPRSQP